MIEIIQTMPTCGLSIPCLALTDACTSFAILNFTENMMKKSTEVVYILREHQTFKNYI